MNVGLFGGTFDPLHIGHIHLALELQEKRGLDLVLFCPAWQSPLKGRVPIASPEDRYEMTRLGIEGIGGFGISDLEYRRPGSPSYTIDTLKHLRTAYPEPSRLHLLLSSESAARFYEWKEAESILRLASPLIGARPRFPPESLPASLRPGITPVLQLEISSTVIRERLKENLYCGHLVPAKVLDYIRTRGLYCSS